MLAMRNAEASLWHLSCFAVLATMLRYIWLSTKDEFVGTIWKCAADTLPPRPPPSSALGRSADPVAINSACATTSRQRCRFRSLGGIPQRERLSW